MVEIPHLVIVGTPDSDELVAIPTRPWTGLDDDNAMRGLGGDDLLAAGGGNDRIDGGPGDDRIDGGGGFDVAVYSQPRQAYQIFWHVLANGRLDATVSGPDGTDSLVSVERLEFPTPSGALDPASPTDFVPFPSLNYAASYTDLARAFGPNEDSAWLHYLNQGLAEGREVTFNGLAYIASYPDLSAAFGPDERQGTLHYLSRGLAEGRAVTFDGLQYVAGHDDLSAFVAPLGSAAATAEFGATHFIVRGRAEGREPDLFDEDQYLANYPDLAAAGLESPDLLALHYIRFGRLEGRTDAALPEPAPTSDLTPSAGTISVTRNGVASEEARSTYVGPVVYLQFQFIGTDMGEVAQAAAGNDFISLLGGGDAADGGAGDDVLDGGTGSSFLTGGAGRDVFFLDGRGGGTTWSTITDWQVGEQLSVWGWTPGVSRATWLDSGGTEGFRGVTMHGDLNGDGAIDTSVTWSGMSRAQLPAAAELGGLLWFA
jgi:Ca2+-binding RTX toxin-like protein